jgi:hypothetical protein
MTLECPPFRQAAISAEWQYEVTLVRDRNGNGRTEDAPRVD